MRGGFEAAAAAWGALRWVMVLAATITLDPDARLPFKWATPGGFIATVLIFASSTTLTYHVANLGSYGQVYGQLGAAVVSMLWL